MSTLLETTDAMVWAEEFCRIFDGRAITSVTHPNDDVDTGTMVGWFANAMAVAEREAAQKFCSHTTGAIELADDLMTCGRCGKVWSESA